jgi:hypothetical protein
LLRRRPVGLHPRLDQIQASNGPNGRGFQIGTTPPGNRDGGFPVARLAPGLFQSGQSAAFFHSGTIIPLGAAAQEPHDDGLVAAVSRMSGGFLWMRKVLLAAVVAFSSMGATAREFDSGWSRIAPGDLSNLELSGGGVRLNNFVVARADRPRGDQPMANYTFSATALKRVEGRRNVRVELVGMKADDTPTITSSIVFNIVNEQPNRTAVNRHRFVAHPGEIEATTSYLIRVLVP